MLTRTLLVFLGAVLFSSTSAQDLVTKINPNAPGAMEKLRTTSPKHYERIRQIVDGLSERQHGEVPRWIRATFEAKDVSYVEDLQRKLPLRGG